MPTTANNSKPSQTVSSADPEQRALRRAQAILRVRKDPGIWLVNCGAISPKAGGTLVRFPELKLNVFQVEVVCIYVYCIDNGIPCRIIILKPRQEGSSTICVAILYTHLRNFRGKGMIIAHERSTTDLLHTIWNTYCDNDVFSEWGSVPLKTRKGFTNKSELHLETANDPNAGRGGTWTAILSSETAYYRTAGVASGEAVFSSMMGGMHDLPNTLTILESTANGMEGLYFDQYQFAISFKDFLAGNKPKTWNGYFKVFFPWFAFDDTKRPVTEEEEKEIWETLSRDEADLINRFAEQHQITAEHIAWWRHKLTQEPYKSNPALFEKDYPRDDVSCFMSSGTFRFDAEGLTEMDNRADGSPEPLYGVLDDGREDFHKPANLDRPVTWTAVHRNESWLRVWEPPRPGCRYLIAADFMTGEQSRGAKDPDCHAVAVYRDGFIDQDGDIWVPKMVAAIWPECRVDTDVLCVWIGLLARYYGHCLVVPEINNSNGLVDLLRQQHCHIYHRVEAVENKAIGTGKQQNRLKKPGWLTTKSSKPDIINHLATRIREQEWSIPCSRARKELRAFMVWPNGTMAAAPGKHDDWVMCQAIASKIMPQATLFQAHRETVHFNSGHRSRPPTHISDAI